jgi:hypothetical protein
VAAIAVLASVIALSLAACGSGGGSSSTAQSRLATAAAIRGAKTAYAKARASGVDLGRGPCIAERLPGLAEWVADIAHDPRTAVDDDPSNQCRRFRSGAATHFVELTPAGRLIRAR